MTLNTHLDSFSFLSIRQVTKLHRSKHRTHRVQQSLCQLAQVCHCHSLSFYLTKPLTCYIALSLTDSWMETMIKEKWAKKLNDRGLKAATLLFSDTHVEEP